VHDDDPVGQKVRAARARALRGLASLADENSPAVANVRQELTAHFDPGEQAPGRLHHGEYHLRALQAARREVLRMRASNEIGDDAFHRVEEDLDWLEMAGGARE
jgi:CPA1 family monovalent cation:H+ antiporter